jgi:hypothetical protein
MNWKSDVDWGERVAKVLNYYADRPRLRYGPARENKAFGLIDTLCANDVVTRTLAMQAHGLSADGVGTILSNVTMAVQGTKDVVAPEMGGWYKGEDVGGWRYWVAPGFRIAWSTNTSATVQL